MANCRSEQGQVSKAMIVYGGSFFSYLGHALACADEDNAQKIKTTWPDEWKKFCMYGSKMKETK